MAKKIVAPNTYNPGKGRPKEKLAYLNEREMAYLRSLNGNNMERGPKGIPSFADDSASSRGVERGESGTMNNSPQNGGRGAGSNYGAGSGRPGTGGTTGGGGLGQGGQGGAGPSGPSGPNSGPSRGAGGQSANLGGGGQGGGPRGPSGPNSGPSASVGGGQRGAGSNYVPGGGSTSGGFSADRQAQRQAQVNDARNALSNPAVGKDLRVAGVSAINVGPMSMPVRVSVPQRQQQFTPNLTRSISAASIPRSSGIGTINVGPMGTPVSVSRPTSAGMSISGPATSGQISRSISEARAAQPGTLVGPVAMSSLAQPTGYSTTFNNQNQVNALRDVMQSQIGFGDRAFTENPNETVRHLAGEVGTSGIGAGQVAQTMINRSLVNADESLPQYTNDLSNREQWASIGNSAYNAASPGSATAGRVADQAIKELMGGVASPNATDFRAINQPGGATTQKVGTDVAGNRFGNFEGVSAEQVAALRAANPIASQFDRVAQASIPLDRSGVSRTASIKSDLGFTPSAQAEPAPSGPLMAGAKPIQDRIISSITPSGGIYSQPLSSIQDTWRKAGYSESDIKKSTDALMNSPTNVAADRYNVLSGISAPPPQPLRSAAGTPTQPYDRRTVVQTGSPRMVDATISQPPKIGSKIGTEYFGPQQYNQPIPEPKSMGLLGDAAAPGTVDQAEQFKNLVNSYTASIPSLKSMAQAYADLQPDVTKYNIAKALRGTEKANELAVEAGNEAGVGEKVAQGIKSLGGMVEKGLVGALSGQVALARAGVAPVPSVDIEGPQRAKETVDRAESGKMYTDRVPGSEDPLSYNPANYGGETNADYQVYSPTDTAAVFSEPAKGYTIAAIAGSPMYSEISDAYGQALAASSPSNTEGGAPSNDVYGPKYVSPEVQEKMADIDRINKYGARIAKSSQIVGPIATLADLGRRLITGKSTTEADADLKRAYMQANSAQRAQLEAAYPNLTKFAQLVGLQPQLPMSNYESWRERSFGNLGQDRSERPNERPTNVASSGGSGTSTETERQPAETGRPAIYYMWDVGVNIPSPGDSNYTLYQQYLAERDAAYG